MTHRSMTLPEVMLIAGTRAALGLGIGLLVADKLNPNTRRGAGCALMAVGILSTIPIIFEILQKPVVSEAPEPL